MYQDISFLANTMLWKPQIHEQNVAATLRILVLGGQSKDQDIAGFLEEYATHAASIRLEVLRLHSVSNVAADAFL
jgi:hypothetical protein